MLGEDILFESCATRFGIVRQDVDTVAGAHSNQAFEFPFGLGFNVFQKGEFAAQNLNEEIAVTAGGFKEAAVEPEGLVAHQIEHGVHLSWIGEHLAMVSHPLAAFDLFRVFVCRHKKSWNFAYDSLGVPRPAHQIGKVHDYSQTFTALPDVLDLWNFKKSVGAKTLYNMLFIFLFFYWFDIDYIGFSFCFILGCKDNFFWIMKNASSKVQLGRL